jgi:hypothetical protein
MVATQAADALSSRRYSRAFLAPLREAEHLPVQEAQEHAPPLRHRPPRSSTQTMA